jgi:hypothetical protein
MIIAYLAPCFEHVTNLFGYTPLGGQDFLRPPSRSAYLLYTFYHFAFMSAQSIGHLFLLGIGRTSAEAFAYISMTETSVPWVGPPALRRVH